MDLKRIIHPLVSVANTDDTTYDKYGRVDMTKKNGLWVFPNWVNKDLKNSTPDGDPKNLDNLPMFTKGDLVYVNVKKSLYGTDLDGNYFFDSYDSWDNTCYISKDKSGSVCKWVLLSDITLFDRSDAIKTMIKDRDDKDKKKKS